jgi:indole-3-pyruvate monooxygenase
VILATGYRPRVNAFLEGASAAYDENGTPSSSGREAPIPGLYFCGYYVSPTGMLREIALEARRISAAIARTKTHKGRVCIAQNADDAVRHPTHAGWRK